MSASDGVRSGGKAGSFFRARLWFVFRTVAESAAVLARDDAARRTETPLNMAMLKFAVDFGGC